MRIPPPPPVKELTHLSPSLYNAAVLCKARAAWAAFGDRAAVPADPRGILGTCFHAVVERAHRGLLPQEESKCRSAARRSFDEEVRLRYDQAHPLLLAKFSSPERLPSYNLFRERAALVAVEAASRASSPHPSGPDQTSRQPRRLIEHRLTSADGLLVGRADCIDLDTEEVVEYKSGFSPIEPVSPAEVRQLRLYVHLGLDNGLNISRGLVVRGDGRRDALNISAQEAATEGTRAREMLHAFNQAAAEGCAFEQIADPSPDHCSGCACISFCDAFWAAADPSWADQCGIHAEGTITDSAPTVLQGTPLVTLQVQIQRGTAGSEPGSLEQIPEAWLTVGSHPIPSAGDTIRLLHGRRAAQDAPLTLRVDRTSTAVWGESPAQATPAASD